MSCAELSKLCLVAVFVNVQSHSSHAHIFYGKCVAGVTQLSSTFTVRWDIWQTSRKRGESKCNTSTVVLAAPQVSLVLSHATGQMWPTAARVDKKQQTNVRQALIMGCGTSVATETQEKRAETGSYENAPLILSRVTHVLVGPPAAGFCQTHLLPSERSFQGGRAGANRL